VKPLLLAFNILCGADAATSHHILSTGGQELVLPTSQPYAVDGLIAAQAVSTTIGLTKIHRTHPRLAIALGWG
jgi:hypothetical protein